MKKLSFIRSIILTVVFACCEIYTSNIIAAQLDDDVHIVKDYLKRMELNDVITLSSVASKNEGESRKVYFELKNKDAVLTEKQRDMLIKLNNIIWPFPRYRNEIVCEELDKVGIAIRRLGIGHDIALILRDYAIKHSDSYLLTGIFDERVMARGDGSAYEDFIHDILLPIMLHFPELDRYLSIEQVGEYADLIIIMIDAGTNPIKYEEGVLCMSDVGGSDEACLAPDKLFNALSMRSKRLALEAKALYICMLLIKQEVLTIEQYNMLKKQPADDNKVQELWSKLPQR